MRAICIMSSDKSTFYGHAYEHEKIVVENVQMVFQAPILFPFPLYARLYAKIISSKWKHRIRLWWWTSIQCFFFYFYHNFNSINRRNLSVAVDSCRTNDRNSIWKYFHKNKVTEYDMIVIRNSHFRIKCRNKNHKMEIFQHFE